MKPPTTGRNAYESTVKEFEQFIVSGIDCGVFNKKMFFISGGIEKIATVLIRWSRDDKDIRIYFAAYFFKVS